LKAKRFQGNASILPATSFLNRKTMFCKPEQALLRYDEQPQDNDPMAMMQNNPMANPDNMMGMLKGNLFSAVLFPLQYAAISYFFSGMIIGKVSFPLTQQFREMLQKGIDVHSIDVKYISSLSLYFLSFMGIDKFFSIFSTDESKLTRPPLEHGTDAADEPGHGRPESDDGSAGRQEEAVPE
jgi:hypothetical protein